MNKGFFASIYDFSFSSFITTRLIQVLYAIALVIAGIYTIFFISVGFAWGAFSGVLFLLLSPLVFILFSILMRVYMELIIMLFRIAENVQKIADRNRGDTGSVEVDFE